MSIEARDFLNFARSLRGIDKPEIDLRCSASRAYYGALHRVDETFKEFGLPVNGRKESSHDRIIGKALHHAKQKKPGKNEAALIASLLPQVKEVRNAADYKLGQDFPLAILDSAMRHVDEVNRLCISVATQMNNALAKSNPKNDLTIAPADSDGPPPEPPPSRPQLKRVQ